MENNEKPNGFFKPIKENPIILDFSNCKTLGELHGILKEQFGLPEYYGENWDALWDSLGDRFSEEREFQIEMRGYEKMPKELLEHSVEMLEIFYELAKIHDGVSFKVAD